MWLITWPKLILRVRLLNPISSLDILLISRLVRWLLLRRFSRLRLLRLPLLLLRAQLLLLLLLLVRQSLRVPGRASAP